MRVRPAITAAVLGVLALTPVAGTAADAPVGLPRTEVVSRWTPDPLASGSFDSAFVSDDGAVVVFHEPRFGAFVRDRRTSSTTSLPVWGRPFGLSGDGRTVALDRGGEVVAFDRVDGSASTFPGLHGVAFAHGGCHVLAWTGVAHDLVVADACTGAVVPVGPATTTADPELGGDISGDGRYVTFVDGGGRLVRVEVASGATVELRGGDGRAGAHPSISADGRTVAFQGTAPHHDLFVVDVASGARRWIPGSAAFVGVDRDPVLDPTGRWLAYRDVDPLRVLPGGPALRLRDLDTGRTEWVSTTAAGVSDEGFDPDVAAGGRFVAFRSGSMVLVPGDTNLPGWEWTGVDVFLRTRGYVLEP